LRPALAAPGRPGVRAARPLPGEEWPGGLPAAGQQAKGAAGRRGLLSTALGEGTALRSGN
ncbi:MAG TPA: hypothetical protein VKD72_26610, partial [Gemmataceae bacterium]|nr:hypothetical protein [Gemmataceae bacterium]